MSAIDFWRTIYPQHRKLEPPQDYAPPRFFEANEEDVWTLAPPWVTSHFLEPERGFLHVLTTDKAQRRRSRSICSHAWTDALPRQSLYQLSDDVFVCSPHFAFLQMAQSLSVVQLAALASELTGYYSFDMHAERGFLARAQTLTSRKALEQFITATAGAYGSAKSMKALEYAVNRSASPKETETALRLRLPYRLGGYGIDGFHMNYEIPLDERARRLYSVNKCRADLCFLDKGLAIEYLGLYDHSDSQAIGHDRGRTLALESLGYEVLELSGLQVGSDKAFDIIALRIAAKIGKRIPVDKRGVLPERVALRTEIWNWNQAHGR
jgi:very-short-patch-repair endonuclease